jgi:hypothetical protein
VIDDSRARKLANDLKRCSYYETCATYGLNVERVFQDGMICKKICLKFFTCDQFSNESKIILPNLRFIQNGIICSKPNFYKIVENETIIVIFVCRTQTIFTHTFFSIFSACQKLCQTRASRPTTPNHHAHYPRPPPPTSCYPAPYMASPTSNGYTPSSAGAPPSPGFHHHSPAHLGGVPVLPPSYQKVT